MKRIPSYPNTQLSRDVEEKRVRMLQLLVDFKADLYGKDKVHCVVRISCCVYGMFIDA